MKLMRNVVVCLIGALMLTSITGCILNSDDVITRKQEQQLIECVKQIGIPAIVNFQEKKMLKALYELRDAENLICYAYLMNTMTGEVGQYLGTCIGYGLPASTQYSNPKHPYSERLQSEPNGLFMPEGLSATWLMMIDPTTHNPRPVYIEPEIIVSPFKLK